MKITKLIAASLLALTVATPAFANDAGQAYVNLGAIKYDVDSSPIGILGRVGYNFSENFGIEGEGSFGITKVTEAALGATGELKVNHNFGGYVIARVPVSDTFDFFARAGYATTKISVDVTTNGTNIDVSGSVDGIAGGVGLQYNFTDNDGLRFDYTYMDADEGLGGLHSLALAYVRNF